MSAWFRSFFAGVGAGGVGGALGIGGGVLLIPHLVKRDGLSQLRAQGTVAPLNAATTLAASGLFLWRQFGPSATARDKSADIDVETAVAASLAASVTAPLGVKLSSRVPELALKRVFAVALLLMAPVTLLKQRYSETHRHAPGEPQRHLTVPQAALAGAVVGGMAAVAGFGQGLLMTTLLAVTTDMEQKQIVGTALLALLAPNVLQAAMHVRVGTVVKPVAAAISIGALCGAPLGSLAALQVDDQVLRYVFTGFLAFSGVLAASSSELTASARIPSHDDVEPGLPTEGVPRIKFEELSFEKLIGEGNYGDVHKGKYFEVDVAIKQIILDDKDYFKYIKREIRILSTMRHPFILQFLGVCEHGPDIFIVTEYLSAGDVTTLLQSQKDVPWTQRLSIATQLCQAMIYLHAKSIIHRDLKPDNILIDEHDNIRLADFGLARVLDTTTRERSLTICGTDGFIAPEVMLGMNYTAQCDVFSFGMVLAQIITRLEPGEDFWNRQQTGELGLNDEEFIALVPPECPPELRDLTLGCGAFEPDDRPPFTDISEVLKYINTKMFGGSVRRAARRSRAPGAGDQLSPADKADMLIGTLSRKTLRETAPIVVAPLDNGGAAPAAAAAAAVAGSGSGSLNLPKDEKSTQMLVFHVMKLVQRSTNEDYSDVPYAQDFLLSFVDFIQPAKLMSLLCQRWLAVPVPPADATNEEREELDRRTKLIRLRSLAFVKMWISRHLNDFDDATTMQHLAKFDDLATSAGFNKGQSMTQLVDKRRQKANEPDVYKFATPPPTAFAPTGALSLATIHAVELARQLTIEMHRLFRKIEMRDLLREGWKRKECGAKQYIDTVSKLALWPASAVLGDKQPARAAETVIELAQHLHDLKNFDALFALLKGLNHPALARLRKLFGALPAKSAATLARLRLLEANDYEKHRAVPPTPPAVPHLAASLDEIAYVEASSESRLASGIINFRRYRHIGRVCGQLQQFQLTPYNLQPVPAITQFVEQQLNALIDDENLKRLSLKLEPPA